MDHWWTVGVYKTKYQVPQGAQKGVEHVPFIHPDIIVDNDPIINRLRRGRQAGLHFWLFLRFNATLR